MSTRWGDDSDRGDQYREEQPSHEPHESQEPPRRKKLTLKPRSQASASTAAHAASSSSSKSNPFGAAKPREEVLASKGIDPKLVEERIEKKAHTVHYTREQETQIAVVQAELTKAEAALRAANENELPEEKYRVVVEEKRKDLNDMLAKFAADASEKEESVTKALKFERPSERRKRLDEERGGHHDEHDGDDGNDAFAHFGGRNKQQHHHDEY